MSSARNIGIKNAKGSYISFIDSDDYIASQTIELLYGCCLQKNAAIAQCGHLRTKSDTEEAIFPAGGFTISLLAGKEPFWSLAGAFGFVRPMLWGKLFLTDLYQELRFPEGKIHEDEATIHRLLYQAGRIACIDVRAYFYYTNPDSIMNGKFDRKRYDVLSALEDRIAFYRQLSWDRLAMVVLLRYLFTLMEYYLMTIEYIPNSVKEQNWLKMLQQQNIPLLLSSPYIDEKTKRQHMEWVKNPNLENYQDAWVYLKSWIKEHYYMVEDDLQNNK